MRIKLLTLMAGPKGIVQPGTIISLPAKEARALIASGQAQDLTKSKPKKETATAAQRETRDEAPADEGA